MKVLMIGSGNMGLTFAEGMSHSPILNGKPLLVYDKDKLKREALRENARFKVYNSLHEAVKSADIVFVAVKPYHCESLFRDMKDFLDPQQIIVSLMAGVTISYIKEGLGIQKVVRTMPNLPAKVQLGVTAFTESKEVSRVELLTVRNLLDATGTAIHVDNELFINKSTGISGSGPAYVFYFMQSMLAAAWKMGFSKHDAQILVSATFEGAVKLFNESDISPERWIDRVASKGGTTQAAIDSMDDNNVDELIKEAAFAAFNRAVELGEETKS